MASVDIEVKQLEMCFEQDRVLHQVDLSISQGDCFVVVGPSGLGKSVLLKLMAGILEPTRGKVLIRGESLYEVSAKRQREIMKKMGMLFQKNALFDSLTCAENIAFPLREVTSATEAEIAEKVEFYLDAVGIPHAAERFPDEISGGMQKRLGIARALALDPDIIFYDDPTAGLDPITSRKIIDLILKTREERNATVVAITNDMNRAYQMADRIGFVFNGEFLETGNPNQTTQFNDKRVQQFIHGQTQGPLTVAK